LFFVSNSFHSNGLLFILLLSEGRAGEALYTSNWCSFSVPLSSKYSVSHFLYDFSHYSLMSYLVPWVIMKVFVYDVTSAAVVLTPKNVPSSNIFRNGQEMRELTSHSLRCEA
jgi:hypothetical protein